jgi:cobalt-zinc-cadmium efflux system membrane fusion protein
MKRIIYITAILAFTAGCNTKQENNSPDAHVEKNSITFTAAQLKNAQLKLDTLHAKTLSGILKVNGKIDVPPQNMVSVSAPAGGYLTQTRLLPGMKVQKGEIIATLEDPQYIQLQQDYLNTTAQLSYREAEYLRQKELNAGKASSDKQLQQAEMEYKTTKINQHALAEKLRLLHITPETLTEKTITRTTHLHAPISGFVSKVNVNIGKYVNPTEILFELVNPDDIHLNLKIFEKDLAQLFIGQHVTAYTNHEPARRHPCRIILVSKDLSPERTAEVHCHFEDYDKTLLPGMYMNAEIAIKTAAVPAVPEEAVLNHEGKNYLFTAENGNIFHMQEVETGTRDNGWVEIKKAESLKGKNIVTVHAYTLLMALKNKPEE